MTITPTPSTPAERENATIYVALELSKARWLVAVNTPISDKISRYEIAGGDSSALLRRIEDIQAAVARERGYRARVVSCYEAGYDGFWLHRVLRGAGIENHVMDAASLPVSRQPRRVKTDRIDVASLLRTLMAWDRGEPQVCSMVQVPSPEAEDRRRRSRERARLVEERGMHLSRISGLLMAHGIRGFRPLRRDWAEQLEHVRTGDGRALPPHLKAEITREVQRLWQVQTMINELDSAARAERRASQDPPAEDSLAERQAPDRAKLLMQLRAIGPVSADILCDEVFFRDFRNRKELAAYVGLTTSPYSSGTTEVDQGLSRAGNRRARQVMVELAWLWLRYQPDSALSRWFRERVGEARGRLRRIMIVALARKLLIALWRYITTGLVPEGAVMSR